MQAVFLDDFYLNLIFHMYLEVEFALHTHTEKMFTQSLHSYKSKEGPWDKIFLFNSSAFISWAHHLHLSISTCCCGSGCFSHLFLTRIDVRRILIFISVNICLALKHLLCTLFAVMDFCFQIAILSCILHTTYIFICLFVRPKPLFYRHSAELF